MLFCQTAIGRAHMARQLEVHVHVDGMLCLNLVFLLFVMYLCIVIFVYIFANAC